MRLDLRGALAALLVLAPALSQAYDFVPTDSEFYAWPAYCRAKYVVTPAGEASPFARTLGQSEVQSGREQVGDAVFLHVHHYCSGMLWVERGKAALDPAQRRFMYNTGIGDLSYFTARIPPESPVMAKALYSLAEAYRGLGDKVSALGTLNQAVQAHPEIPASHIALGLYLRDSKDLAGARKALEDGVQMAGEHSAELNYDLALVLLESNENEAAVKYAHKAYELGYPLAGLRNKLIRLGLWDTPPEAAQR